MALSDCEKCWSTPCECGNGYINWTKERLINFIAVVNKKPLAEQEEILEEVLNKIQKK